MLKEHEIPTSQAPLPFESKYPLTVWVKVDWPVKFRHDNKNFLISDNHGIHLNTGLPSCRYHLEGDPHEFVWLLTDGTVVPD